MINVTKTHLPSLKDYIKYLEKIWETGQITNNGPLSKELGEKLKDHLGVHHIELTANGTLALQLAIRALDLKGEIITTPFSYVATTAAILWEGCKPVFVDIEDRTFCIDPDKIESAITKNTSAILATHVFGFPCNVKKIDMIAKKHNIKVIYDSAHAFGVKIDGQSILNFGDVSALSFHATKTFHTGEGGALICKDESIANVIFLLKKFGHIGEENYTALGINAKISELHAAMGLCILKNSNSIITNREKLHEYYNYFFNKQSLRRPIIPKGIEYNYGYYPIILPTHEIMMLVKNALIKNNIIPRRYFYPSLNTLPYLSQENRASCPISEDISNRILCIPMYEELELSDADKIIKIILEHG